MSGKRRGHGEGSVYQRQDGRWAATISLGNGRRRSYYGRTREDVRAKLIAALHARDSGTLVSARSETVGAFLTRWLEDVQVRPLTHDSYRRKIQLHVIPTLGRIPLQKLSPQDVNALLRAKARTLSPQTIQHVRSVFRNALNRAVKWGLIHRNPAALADVPHVEQYEPSYLNVEQARAFLDAARGDRLEAVYAVALSLGLRQGEALGLRWQDVDLDAATIRIQKALQRLRGRGLQLVEPKTARSKRTLVMPETLVRALRAHRARQLEERMRAGSLWEDHGFLFTTHCGRPLSARNVMRDSFHKIRRRAGMPPGLRFHDLRHSAATLLLAQGVPQRAVMEILGHSTLAMTQRYTHVVPQLLRDAAAAMDRALGSG